MKHIVHFDDFLNDVVNLNQGRIDTLQERVQAISRFVQNSTYEPNILRFNPQGSWAHQTIIKPPGNRDFDADLLLVVEQVPEWEPSQYIQELYDIFRASERYRELVSRKTRCMRIDYANDFHIDLIPIIQEMGHNGRRFFNCNRRTNEFEETAPEAYTEWWSDRNLITGDNQLRYVTRLLKFLRDIKGTFSCKSILLTTLVGYQIRPDDQFEREQYFSDLPTSLKTIVSRLDDLLQMHEQMPVVQNPVLRGEDYNRHWNQEKYSNFRSKIHNYRQWIDDAYIEQDENESILKWRRVFGDEFAKSVNVRANTPQIARLFRFSDNWISRIRDLGSQVLREFPTEIEHVKQPPWRVENQIVVNVSAHLAREKNGTIIGPMSSGEVIQGGLWVRFQASSPAGIPPTFRVEWRVVNTGGQAILDRSRRGGFEPSLPRGIRWEHTKYRGVHWVEAFVVNDRTNSCVGKSERFFVVVG